MAIPVGQQISQIKFKQRHPLYIKWRSMRSRCYYKKDASYTFYGRRGIQVCPEWLSYKSFEKDMLPFYKKGLSLDRLDNNKDYSKENCRWANSKEQANNRRNNHLLKFKGIADTITNWANHFGLRKPTLYSRIFEREWSTEKALFTGNGGGF